MDSNKLFIEIPSFVASKTDSVEATLSLKQTLSQVFTEFYRSDTFGSMDAAQRGVIADLNQDLFMVIDRCFVAQVLDAAALAKDKRTSY